MEREIFVKVSREELDKLDNKLEYSVEELVSMLFSKIEDVKCETGINPNTMQRYYQKNGTVYVKGGHVDICYYGYERNDR